MVGNSEADDGPDKTKKPQIHGGSIFLVDLALQFQACGRLRENTSVQALAQRLESISLVLTGYYQEKDAEKKVSKTNQEIRKLVNDAVKIYDKTKKIQVSQTLKDKLYQHEQYLRQAWKDSGLQMSFSSEDEDLDF